MKARNDSQPRPAQKSGGRNAPGRAPSKTTVKTRRREQAGYLGVGSAQASGALLIAFCKAGGRS